MRHNISTLWKEEEKLFEPNFEIKDVTVFVNDDARYMGGVRLVRLQSDALLRCTLLGKMMKL